MVEVVHHAVVVAVDVDVRGVTVHVPAEIGASAGVPAGVVVLRRAEAAHHRHAADVHAMR